MLINKRKILKSFFLLLLLQVIWLLTKTISAKWPPRLKYTSGQEESQDIIFLLLTSTLDDVGCNAYNQ